MMVKSVEIKCSNCKTWFPSPISFGDMGSFDTTILIGNIVDCLNCGKPTGCNKENIKIKSTDGGFQGKDT